MGKATIASLEARINELENRLSINCDALELSNEIIKVLEVRVEELGNQPTRDYGPSKENEMTKIMAWRIRFGDLRLKRNGGLFTAKEIAREYGFSNGQVYSVDGGYTFKSLTEDSFTMEDVIS